MDRIEGEEDVVLEQGFTRMIAEKAIYVFGPDKENVQFLGHAIWQDGERQGSGERVDYDRRKRLLVAQGNAYLRLPRSALGEADLLSGSPRARPAAATNAASSYVEVFSDRMTVQMSPTNGPVQSMIAEKNVLIVDPMQDGRALADQATYREATGLLELSGSPILETQQRLINGKVLQFDRTNRVFRATPDAYVKLPFHALASLGLLSKGIEKPKGPASVPNQKGVGAAPNQKGLGAATNQFVEVWAKSFEYRTNLLRFVGDVRANFLESDVALGQMTCGNLTFYYGEQLDSMAAEDNVQVEQFPVAKSPKQVRRKLSCPKLRAEFGPTGKLDSAWAEQGVVVEQEETGPKQPNPVFTRMTADSLTAFFSKSTNKVERVVAEKDVRVKQGERTVRGAKAVYTEATELLELTGQPTASMPEGDITEAERLIWDRAHTRFIGRGKFRSSWKRAAAGTNQLTSPLSFAH